MKFLSALRKGRAEPEAPRVEPVLTPALPAQVMSELKYSKAGVMVQSLEVGMPKWTPHDYAKLAHEAFVLNPVGYRCVKLIAQCAASIGWTLTDRSGEMLDDHPLLKLLARPSPMNGGAYLMESAFTYLLLSGNLYLEGVGPNNKNKPYRELYALRPDRMRIVPGGFGLPKAFEYTVQGKKTVWDVDELTGASDILHVKEFNPLDDWYGLSRVIPAAMGIDRFNASASHNKALLDNGARPSGALIFEPFIEDGMGSVSIAPKEVIEKAEKELQARHTGAQNAGRPMVFNGKVKWEEMGLSPKDMDFDENKQDSARDICTAWGVPHILIVKGQSTYNNVREAKLELYEDTVLPLAEMVLDELNHWLTPRFDDALTLGHDLDSISALEYRRQSKRKSVTELLDGGVIDDEEARAELGYGERDPNVVKAVDSSVLQALVSAAEVVGTTPLFRYMKSVGLLEPGMTEEQMLNAALSLIEDDTDKEDDETDGEDTQTSTENEDDDNDV